MQPERSSTSAAGARGTASVETASAICASFQVTLNSGLLRCREEKLCQAVAGYNNHFGAGRYDHSAVAIDDRFIADDIASGDRGIVLRCQRFPHFRDFHNEKCFLCS
jgi:hypothetical protein